MSFINTLSKEDEDAVAETIYNQYWYLMNIGCLYAKLDTPKWRIISAVHYGLTCIVLWYFVVVMTVTAMKTDNVMEGSQCMHYVAILLLVMCITMTVNKRRPEMARIHHGMGLGLSDYDEETEQHREILNARVRKYKGILIKLFVGYCIVGAPFLIYLRIFSGDTAGSDYEVYNNNDISLNLPVPQWSPFSTDSPVTCLIAATLQLLVCSIVVVAGFGFNLLYLTVASNIAAELDLLIISLDRLPERTLNLFQLRYGYERSRQVDMNKIREDKDLSQCYADCLKQNVIHHQRIIKTFHDLISLLSSILFIALSTAAFYIAISGALILFAQGSITARSAAALCCCAETVNTFFHCLCAELIIDGNEELRRKLYSTNWMSTNKKNARTIALMMTIANQPLVMNYKNILKINFETFANIMNSAYSFFSLLNAVEIEIN